MTPTISDLSAAQQFHVAASVTLTPDHVVVSGVHALFTVETGAAAQFLHDRRVSAFLAEGIVVIAACREIGDAKQIHARYGQPVSLQ